MSSSVTKNTFICFWFINPNFILLVQNEIKTKIQKKRKKEKKNNEISTKFDRLGQVCNARYGKPLSIFFRIR